MKNESKAIGEHEYNVVQWNATYAMVMKLKLLKYFGKALQNLSASDMTFNQKMMSSLNDIIAEVDPDEFIKFIKEVACAAVRDGERMKTVQFDMYFKDDILEAYQVAFFVLEVNYKDFLESVLNLLNGKLSS